MNEKFKAWLLEDSKGWNPEDKKAILTMVKKDPEKLIGFIAGELSEWATVFVLSSGVTMAIHSLNATAHELVDAYRELYAEELEVIV